MRTPVILLKGASYVLLGLPSADGRVFTDIDILVAHTHIAAAEAALMLGGWSPESSMPTISATTGSGPTKFRQ